MEKVWPNSQKGFVVVSAVAVVLMGVSGVGKTTVGRLLADEVNCTFLDADDFHTAESRGKMKKGIPLTDHDRIPWLEKLRDVLADYIIEGKPVILACSALRRAYREILQAADPNYHVAIGAGCKCSCKKMIFIYLKADAEIISARIEARYKAGNHYMPPSLLQSQINTLEVDENEGIITVDAGMELEDIKQLILRLIKHKST